MRMCVYAARQDVQSTGVNRSHASGHNEVWSDVTVGCLGFAIKDEKITLVRQTKLISKSNLPDDALLDVNVSVKDGIVVDAFAALDENTILRTLHYSNEK